MLSMAWQFASPKQDGSYVGIEGVSELQDRWAMSAESVRAWGRFMLPYKSDGVRISRGKPREGSVLRSIYVGRRWSPHIFCWQCLVQGTAHALW